MASEQTGAVALGIAVIAALANIIDRLIARWRPRSKKSPRDPAEALAQERAELSREWAEYRREVDVQLQRCRTENESMYRELTSTRLRVVVLEAKVRALGGEP